MKKMKYLCVALVSILMFSCTMNENYLIKADNSVSYNMTVEISKDLASKSKEKNKKEKLAKMPSDWISLYDYSVREGKKISKSLDTIKMLKSYFVKFNKLNDTTLTGFSIKVDNLTKDVMDKGISPFTAFSDDPNVASNPTMKGLMHLQWNGNNLIIHTGGDPLKGMTEEDGKPMEDEVAKNTLKFMSSIFSKSDFKLNTTITFEKSIVEIKGKHDCVTKVDDHTIKYSYSFYDLMQKRMDNKKMTFTDEKLEVILK